MLSNFIEISLELNFSRILRTDKQCCRQLVGHK